MKVPHELTDFFRSRDDFFLATHINPEGDALGSSIALHLALMAMGKRSVVYNRDLVPATYAFLPHSDIVVASHPDRIENLVLIDCNSPERAGMENVSTSCAAVIDHHKTMNGFGDVMWIDPACPAAGLMVYYLIKDMDVEITPEMAVNLYTAIGIDTGIFRYSNTTADCLVAASDLVLRGAEPGMIADRLFNNYSRERFLLLQEMFSTIELHGQAAVMVVSGEMYERTGTTAEDTENFVNYPLMMEDVRVSVLFRQLDENSWKISMRSKGVYDVSTVAVEFGGGGHRNAAGCMIEGDIESVRSAVLERVQRLFG